MLRFFVVFFREVALRLRADAAVRPFLASSPELLAGLPATEGSLMFAWLWKWIATRAATAWVLALAVAAVSALGIYIQQLRVDAARCIGREEAQVLIDKLTDRQIETIEEEADQAVHDIPGTTNEEDRDCLSARGPQSAIDFLRDQ